MALIWVKNHLSAQYCACTRTMLKDSEQQKTALKRINLTLDTQVRPDEGKP